MPCKNFSIYPERVCKRDGVTIEPYDQSKIENVLKSLFKTSKDVPVDCIANEAIVVANDVTFSLSLKYKEDSVIPTRVIQEYIERKLMEFRYFYSLKQFIILAYAKDCFELCRLDHISK